MFNIYDCSSDTDVPYTSAATENNTTFNTSLTAQASAVSKVIRYDVSVDLVTAMDFYLNCVLLHALCACGIVGNVINIVILSRRGYRKTTNVLLTSLSVSDLVFSVTQSVSRWWSIAARLDAGAARTLHAVYVVYVRTWNEVSLMASIYQVTIIALVRLLAVCYPLQVHRIVTPLRAKYLTCFVYIVLAVLASPTQLMYELRWVGGPGNTIMATYQPSSFYISHGEGINFYLAAILSNTRSSVPLAVVSVCSALIIVRLSTSPHKLLRRQLDSAPKRAKTVRSVKMLMTMCFSLMLLVLLPTTTFEGYISFDADQSWLSCRFKVVVMYVSNFLFQLSCSLNFVVYFTMNSKFAQTYRHFFCYKGNTPRPTNRMYCTRNVLKKLSRPIHDQTALWTGSNSPVDMIKQPDEL
ncbi:hypothetical protein Btru_032609 [Bulinus truncatus]|nr:hypothetical protein Btru_032609 [Bulinus truncatus]